MTKAVTQLKPHNKSVRTEIMEVTPDMCTHWLENNTNNRPLNQRHVNVLTRTMAQGDWDLNGESLKLDVDGNVLDGQHRMWACIESETPFTTMVVFNLPRETFDTIDTGRVRQAHDVLAMRGEHNTTLMSSMLKHIGRYYSGQMLQTKKLTNKEVERLLEAHPRVRDLAIQLTRKGYRVRWCAPSVIGSAWYIATKRNKEQADTFFHGLIFGMNLNQGSPILTLRNKFIELDGVKGKKLLSPDKLNLIAIAWNAYRDGKQLTHFKINSLAKESKDFPKFK